MTTRKLYHYNGDPKEHSSIRDSSHMTVASNLHHEDAREIAKRWNSHEELLDLVRRMGAHIADQCGDGLIHPLAAEARDLITKAQGE